MLLVLGMTIWAANYPVAKWGIAGLDIHVFNAIRFIVAASLVSFIFRTGHSWREVAREDRWPLLRAGIVASVLYQVAFIVGLKLTTAGNSAVLLATSPLWTLLWQARLHRERIPVPTIVGMSISLAGIALIVVGSGRELKLGGSAVAGDLVMLSSAALWGLNTNLQKPLVARYPSMQVTLILLAIGAAGLTLIAIPAGLAADWARADWTHVLAAAASGAFSIGVANMIWSRGVKRLGPGRTANFNNLVPILAFIISWYTLQEPVHTMHFVGAGVTLAGVWYARRER
jgi:drug/metabolite transporter (DMT)-like permease